MCSTITGVLSKLFVYDSSYHQKSFLHKYSKRFLTIIGAEKKLWFFERARLRSGVHQPGTGKSSSRHTTKLKFVLAIPIVGWLKLLTSWIRWRDWYLTYKPETSLCWHQHKSENVTNQLIFSRNPFLESFKITSCVWPKKLWSLNFRF